MRAALWWIWGAVVVLLIVASGNVAALMLARGLQRTREQAVRLALGANNWALWRSSIVESYLIAVIGGAAGLIVAHWLLAAIVALAPDDVPRLAETSVNMPVILFTFGLTLAAALVSASAPMLQMKRLSLVTNLNDGAHGTAGRSSTNVRALLLALQVALSVLLTTAAGLILRSYINVHQLDLGFIPDQE